MQKCFAIQNASVRWAESVSLSSIFPLSHSRQMIHSVQLAALRHREKNQVPMAVGNQNRVLESRERRAILSDLRAPVRVASLFADSHNYANAVVREFPQFESRFRNSNNEFDCDNFRIWPRIGSRSREADSLEPESSHADDRYCLLLISRSVRQ